MARTTRKGQQADRAKSKANADRVAAMNAERDAAVVHVAEGRDGTKRAHRVTCTRVPADHFETTAYTAVNLHRAVAASCCKPQLPEPRAEQPEAQPEPTPEAPQPATDRVERTKLAKAEHQALKEWEKGGRQGDRPATPNYDAIQVQAANGGAREAKRTSTSGGRRSSVELGTLPEGATEGTCRGCGQVLPVSRFPKARVDGKRSATLRADECRACRDARRKGAEPDAERKAS